MNIVTRFWPFSTILLLAVLLSPVTSLIQGLQNKEKPGTSFEQNQLVEIGTGWEYQWGNVKNISLLSASAWESLTIPINPPDRNGSSILWLKNRLPDRSWKDPALLIDGKGVLLTFEMYLDDALIYKFGRLSPTGEGKISGISSHLVPLPADCQGRTLIFRVFSDYSNIGIRGNVIVGTRPDLIMRIIKTDISALILAFFMLLIGIRGLYSYQKSNNETGPLSMFGILSISLGFYTLNLISLKDLVFFAPTFWFNTYIVSMVLIPIGAIGITWQTFRPSHGNYLYWISRFHIIYAIICQTTFVLAFNSILPLMFGTFLLTVLRWLLIPEMILILGIAFTDAFLKRDPQALIYFCGFIPLVVAGIHDTLTGLGVIDTSGSYIPWALMVFILCLELIRNQKNTAMQRSLESYAGELERKSKERAQLSSDLHDGIGGLITNIKFLSEIGLKNSKVQTMKEILTNISTLASDSLVEIGSFMKSIDKEAIEWSTVLQEFATIAEKTIKPLGLSFYLEHDIDETVKQPDFVFFLNLLRIYKEALANIIKHANAKKVTMSLVVSKNQLQLSLKDDGSGFEHKLPEQQGRGLRNMKARAQKLGGKLSITSDQGTSVNLKITFP